MQEDAHLACIESSYVAGILSTVTVAGPVSLFTSKMTAACTRGMALEYVLSLTGR